MIQPVLLTLADFLLARIAEDFIAADLVLRPYGDSAATNEAHWWIDDQEWYRMGLSSDETPLLTRYTPQRVLAESASKRRIVEDIAANYLDHAGGIESTDELAGRVLEYLALPYADHPEYREEWRA